MLIGKYFEGSEAMVLDLRRVRFERTYMKTGHPLNASEFGRQVIYAEKIPEGIILVTKGRLDEETLKNFLNTVRSYFMRYLVDEQITTKEATDNFDDFQIRF